MRRSRHQEAEEGDGELNLVPYLDMMVTLVMFLLFSFQAMLEMGLIPMNAPAYDASPGPSQPQKDPDKPVIMVTLVIGDSGYNVQSDHPEITGTLDIPKLGDGKYDLAGLRGKMIEWKKTHGLNENLVITAFNNIEYQTVVDAMDELRKDGDKDLYPNVVLGVPYGGSGQ
jgi:biopolymer transport protein ExbD